MRSLKSLLLHLLLLSSLFTYAQKGTAFVSGRVIDENEKELAQVSVIILGKITGTTTGDSGYFRLKVQAAKAF
ncbi:MAG: carboxypeptidase-like regulatory domain-containing protein, partial [Chitinophagaceae bacterium]